MFINIKAEFDWAGNSQLTWQCHSCLPVYEVRIWPFNVTARREKCKMLQILVGSQNGDDSHALSHLYTVMRIKLNHCFSHKTATSVC